MLLLLLVLVVFFGVYYLYESLTYWARRNVKYARTFSPLGTFWENVLQVGSMADILKRLYNTFPDEPFFGIYTFLKPTLIIRDPELIKELTVKQLDTFIGHRLFSTNDPDQALTHNLFVTEGHIWKATRPALSPCFTGSKIRAMFSLVKQCAQNGMTRYLEEDKELVEIDIKLGLIHRFTVDVIVNCVFGFNSNCFKEEDQELFHRMESSADFGGIKIFSLFGYCLPQWAVKLFNLRVVPTENEEYFTKIVRDSIKQRKELGIIRPDMIHLLMEAQKGKVKHDTNDLLNDTGYATIKESAVDKAKPSIEMSDSDLLAHAMLFMIAGTDTPACTLNFGMYELAMNPDVQQRLFEEVNRAITEDGDIGFEELINLKYLDMVCSEILRKWPPLPLTDRYTERSYTINYNGRTAHLPVGSIIWLPIMAIHRDPKYYENPEKFDPERFNEENKGRIAKETYMPFGVGPKACIGSRLAMLILKSIIAYTVRNFDVVPVEKTPSPLKLSRKHIFLNPDRPMVLGLRRRRQCA